jgi:hypothetical protein
MTTDATAALQAKYGDLLVDLHALHVQATVLRHRFHDLCNEGTPIFDALTADVSPAEQDALLNWFLEEVGFNAATGILDQLTNLLHPDLDDPDGQRRLIDSYGTS